MASKTYPVRLLVAVLVVAAVARALLVALGHMSFHGDEGIVALMARHITQGQHMTFFYGQPYMGSLNAYPTALGFLLLGESVDTLRWVQWAKNLLMVWSAFALGWQLTRNRIVATSMGLYMAIPPVVGALYTATNIGGYVETLFFGHLMILLTHRIVAEESRRAWDWGLLGLVAGLAWWANGLIVVYGIPVVIVLGWHLLRAKSGQLWGLLGLTVVLFIVGGGPYWWHTFAHDFKTLGVYFPELFPPEVGDIQPLETDLVTKILGLTLFGLPSTVGLRHPWAAAYFLFVWGLPAAIMTVIGGYVTLRDKATTWQVKVLLFGVMVSIVAVFLGTSFGSDPTGRYFLPILTVSAFTWGVWTARLSEVASMRRLWWLPLVFTLVYYGAGQYDAASKVYPGMTTQFDLYNHLTHDDDEALIAFLEEHDLMHGYTSYWVAIRLAFYTQEAMQYSSTLPYKRDLSYNPVDNRYPPYAEATENAERVAYINVTRNPELDVVLREEFDAMGLTYAVETIGQFIVYYDFEPTTPRLVFGPTTD